MFTPHSDPANKMSEQTLWLNKPANVFPVFYCPILVSMFLRFLVLADSSGTRCHLLQGLTCGAFRDGLLLPFCHLVPVWPFSTGLWHKAFWHRELLHTGYIFYLSDHPLNPGGGCAWTSQQIRSSWNTQTSLCGTNNWCHVQRHWNHSSSPFWWSLWTSQGRPDHVYMHKCVELLLGWLATRVNVQLNRCT